MAPTAKTPSERDGLASLARLETALSALIRWSESKHIRLEVARRSGCDVSPSEMRLLEHFDLSGPMRVSDIAECMHIDISTVSLQLRQLRRKLLVDQSKDPRDRRVSLITITDDGRDAVRRTRRARCELLEKVFVQVEPDELEQAAAVLLRVQEHMLQGMADFMRSRD
ncbi:MarR family winged helix-turn-helix transcriptional regulator [Frankia sp. QA3]|uniref:MarR family winged helix-turn-helix transcriptional regulator n=1 Tax=Frankia sp. QA3 TaxID=710111 RepID=UPI000269C06F|nr:MarR family transcriptional regulator [Frankia sp. QA3]EIV92500.1 transcriptional regulator [Frankia sp. QA3]